MIETLPASLRLWLASIILQRDIGGIITRLNTVHSRCHQLEIAEKASAQYAERLNEHCRKCKEENTDHGSRSSRHRHYDVHLDLPDEATLTKEFIQTVRTYFRGRYEQMKSESGFPTVSAFMPRKVGVLYMVTQFQLEHAAVTTSMQRSFLAILKKYFRRSIQLIGYVGENRFIVIDIGNNVSRHSTAIAGYVRSNVEKTAVLKGIVLRSGSSTDRNISLSLDARSIQREDWINAANELEAAIQESYLDMTTAT